MPHIPERLVALASAIVSGFALLVVTIIGFSSDLQERIPLSFAVEVREGRPMVSFWMLVLFVLLVALLFIAAVALARSRFGAWGELVSTTARARAAEAAYQRVLATTAALVQDWTGRPVLGWRYTKIDERYEVEADSTTTATRTYCLEATQALTGFRITIDADPGAEAAAYPNDIEFDVISLDVEAGKTVEFLPVENEAHAKVFAILFLPPMQAGESRNFRTKMRWRRFASDLIDRGSTDFRFDFITSDPRDTAELSMEFAFSRALGPIRFEQQAGEPIPLLRGPEGAGQYAVWFYRKADFAMHETELAFRAERSRSTGSAARTAHGVT